MLLKDGKCVACPKNAKCDGTETFTCKRSYGLNTEKGECWHCPAGCAACEVREDSSDPNPNVMCTSCENGFVLHEVIGAFGKYYKGKGMCRPINCTGGGLVSESKPVPSGHFGLWVDALYCYCRNGSNNCNNQKYCRGCKGRTNCNNADLRLYNY